MTAGATGDAYAKPYKGLDSFRVEDAELFYGRDRDTEQLLAQILSARVTLLHAPSGAGKSSLLNARIIPALESSGWWPVRALPLDNPIASIKEETLRYLLPPPAAEALALERATGALGCGADTTIAELLHGYDRLAIRSLERRRLIAPVETSGPAVVSAPGAPEPYVPYLCRLLRSSMEVGTFADHLAALLGQPPDTPLITEHTPLRDLRQLLADPALARAYEQLSTDAYAPVPSLAAFFLNLADTYGRRRRRFAVVLLLDQFEELFTRFVDSGPGVRDQWENLPDWRLRRKLFEELEQLYAGEAAASPPASAAEPPVPLAIRYVISMRDEYIAQLDPIRRFAPALDQSTYHLGFLRRREAEVAIEEPAKQYGYGYAPECLNHILADLVKEEQFVEPIHVQIVCEKLWEELGRHLSGAASQADAAAPRQIPLAALEQLGGAAGILASFLSTFLGELELRDRLDALELLERLITSARTRNIVEESALVQAPFRNANRRRRLVQALQRRGIVRIERRLGGLFAEITHEFLIGPILQEVRRAAASEPAYRGLSDALRALERLCQSDFREIDADLLTEQELLMLHEHRDYVMWSSPAVELMFRSAIHHGLDEAIMREWGHQFAGLVALPDAAVLVERLASGSDVLRSLSLEELDQVNRVRSELSLPPQATEVIFRAQLRYARPEQIADVEYWTGRMHDQVTRARRHRAGVSPLVGAASAQERVRGAAGAGDA